MSCAYGTLVAVGASLLAGDEALQRRGPFSTFRLGPTYFGDHETVHFDFGPELFFRL